MQERFNQLMEVTGLSASKFATTIGSSSSTISHILSGRNKPGYDILFNISTVFPDINLNWLIKGEGSMYINQQHTENIAAIRQQPTLFDVQTEEPGNNPTGEKDAAIAPVLPLKETLVANSTAKDTVNNATRRIKRIVFFFEDGSFEEYRAEN